MNTQSQQIQKIDSAIQKGINFLYDHQLANGEFMLYISGDDEMQGWNSLESSNFAAVLIGSCLLALKDNKKVDEILNKTAEFLKHQIGIGGSWNHYTKIHLFRDLNCQDVDDTACIAKFLKEMNYSFPEEKTRNILLNNRRKDGLFYTWITFRFNWSLNKHYWYLIAKQLKHPFKNIPFWIRFSYTIDAVVNANVLYYLDNQLEGKPIIQYLNKTIENESENKCDTWYPEPCAVYYFISRNYSAGIKSLKKNQPFIIERIRILFQKEEPTANSALYSAMALSTLLNFDCNDYDLVNKLAHNIINKQNENGCWSRRILYTAGPVLDAGYGSEELTTGFCLEALKKYKRFISF